VGPELKATSTLKDANILELLKLMKKKPQTRKQKEKKEKLERSSLSGGRPTLDRSGGDSSIGQGGTQYTSQRDFITKQDMGGYPFQLHLMFTEKNRDRIMRSIKADSTFLKGKGIMDYSLLLICEEIQHDDEADIKAHFTNSVAGTESIPETPIVHDNDEEDVIEGQLAGQLTTPSNKNTLDIHTQV